MVLSTLSSCPDWVFAWPLLDGHRMHVTVHVIERLGHGCMGSE